MRYRKLTTDGTHDMCFGRGVSDYLQDSTNNPDAIAQAIKTRLLLFYGEWWEDITDGLPMWQKILGQRIKDKGIIDRIIVDNIQGLKLPDPDNRYAITRVDNVVSIYNSINREYSFSCTANTQYGTVVVTNAAQESGWSSSGTSGTSGSSGTAGSTFVVVAVGPLRDEIDVDVDSPIEITFSRVYDKHTAVAGNVYLEYEVDYLSVLSTNPVDGGTGVSRNTTIEITFNENIDSSTVSSSTFVTDGITGTYETIDDVVTFTPSSPLDYSTTYDIEITTGLKSLIGQPLETPYTFSFETGDVPLMSLDSTTPAQGDINVILSPILSATFNYNVAGASIDGNVSLVDFESNPVPFMTYMSGDPTFVFIEPTIPLNYNSVYTMKFLTGLQSEEGYYLDAAYNISFTTIVPFAIEVIEPTIPASEEVVPIGTTTITITFDKALSIYANSIDVNGTVLDPTYNGVTHTLSTSWDTTSLETVVVTVLKDAITATDTSQLEEDYIFTFYGESNWLLWMRGDNVEV